MLPKKIRTSRNTEKTGLLLDFQGADCAAGPSESFKTGTFALTRCDSRLRPWVATKTPNISIGYVSCCPLSQKLCKTVMFVARTGCELRPFHVVKTPPGPSFDRYHLARKSTVAIVPG
jgi:hypothetical protein